MSGRATAIPYAFAKANGVVLTSLAADGAHVSIRADARAGALAEVRRVLGVPVRKAVIAVDAGRNLAVLVEAAVRNTILQLRGIDTYKEFIERHRIAMEGGDGADL